jgi:hypothetical protein
MLTLNSVIVNTDRIENTPHSLARAHTRMSRTRLRQPHARSTEVGVYCAAHNTAVPQVLRETLEGVSQELCGKVCAPLVGLPAQVDRSLVQISASICLSTRARVHATYS